MFPDPWPKKRHKKRRLINSEFVNLLESITFDKTKIIIATDHNDYLNQILYEFYKSKHFKKESFIWKSLLKRNSILLWSKMCLMKTKFFLNKKVGVKKTNITKSAMGVSVDDYPFSWIEK